MKFVLGAVMAMAFGAAEPQSVPQSAPPNAPSSAPRVGAAPAQTAPQQSAPAEGDGGSLGYLTADELARRCRDTAPASVSYCFAYISATHDTVRAYEIWLQQREFCPPADTPQSDLRRAFLTYLGAYPGKGSGQASSLIVVALKETYPCATPAVRPAPAQPEPAPTPATRR